MEDIATWRGRPAPVWTLALFAAASSLLCLAGLMLGGTRPPLATLQAVTTVGAGTIALGLWLAGERTPRWLVQAVLVVAALTITALVALARTGEGAVSIALGFTWLSVHTALFSGRGTARLHATLGTVGCGTGLALSVPGVSGVLAWILLSTTAIVAGETLGVLFDRTRALSLTDHLTRLPNRTGFALAVERERAAARRSGEPLVVVAVDLDGFKAVNDEHGHDAGDRLLATLARDWAAHLRPRDVLGRLGGDEFALAFPATTPEEAEALLRRLRTYSPLPYSAGTVVLTAVEPLDEALHRADRRMYEEKHQRREQARRPLGLEPVEVPAVTDPGPAEPVVQARGTPLPQLDGVRP